MARPVAVLMLFINLFSQPTLAVENSSWGEVKSEFSNAPVGKLVVTKGKVAGRKEELDLLDGYSLVYFNLTGAGDRQLDFSEGPKYKVSVSNNLGFCLVEAVLRRETTFWVPAGNYRVEFYTVDEPEKKLISRNITLRGGVVNKFDVSLGTNVSYRISRFRQKENGEGGFILDIPLKVIRNRVFPIGSKIPLRWYTFGFKSWYQMKISISQSTVDSYVGKEIGLFPVYLNGFEWDTAGMSPGGYIIYAESPNYPYSSMGILIWLE